MKTKHTEGKWALCANQRWPFDMTIECGDIVIVNLRMSHYSTSDNTIDDCLKRDPINNGEAIANAKLITAAPDLLNACDAVLTAWHSKLSNMHKKEPVYLRQIREAIHNATE